MPKLNCCVTNCAYNEETCCCLGKIHIEGGEAAVPSETCCNTFIEKGDLSNSIQQPKGQVEIDCLAIRCIHNKACKCNADYISVVGQDATTSDGTQCNAFCKC